MFSNQRYFVSEGVIGVIQRTLNMVDERLINHGTRVAHLAHLMMGNEEQSALQKRNMGLLCILHDIGAYKAEEIKDLFEIESKNYWPHCIYGYLFLKHFSFLKEEAVAVLFHHLPWQELLQIDEISHEDRLLSQTIYIADRADVYLETQDCDEVSFRSWLQDQKEKDFYPELVDALLAGDLSSCFEEGRVPCQTFVDELVASTFTAEEVSKSLELLVFAIDFRSSHTVTHTITTGAISRGIARRMDLNEDELQEITCGALLHDLGKMGIPVEILEKPGRLTSEEMTIMRTHVDLTRQILGDAVPVVIREIALRHHEKLDGTGYPLGLLGAEITLAERIVVVADLVSALYSSRSYKDAFPKERTLSILGENAADGKIDPAVVEVIVSNYGEIIEEVKEVCKPVLEVYRKISSEYQRVAGKIMELGLWKV